MKRLRYNVMAQILSFIAITLLALPIGSGVVFAKEQIKATTTVKHKPVKFFVPENRIKLDATVKDKAGIDIVRCYFRALEQADFVFVAMETTKKGIYEGVLPAPSKETEIIEYLFLAVNGENHVVKTQTFEMHKKDDDKVPVWQQVSSEGDIMVSTELAYAPTAPPGFTDSIAMNAVESSARFGVVVGGIYGPEVTDKDKADAPKMAALPVTGTAGEAVSDGTIIGTTDRSTAGYVALGGLLIAGGVIAADSGGGDDGGGGGSVTAYDENTPLTQETIVGTWDYVGNEGGYTLNGDLTFNNDGTFSFNAEPSPVSSGRSGIGTWTLTDTRLHIKEADYGEYPEYPNAEGHTLDATVTGSAVQFTATSDMGGTYTFTRR